MTGTQAVLERGARCLLACAGAAGPLVVPSAYWYDGEALWTVAAAGAPEVPALERDGACAVHVRAGLDAVIARGRARLLSLHDPLGMLLRAPAITGAMAALALRDPSATLGSAMDAVLHPSRLVPQNARVLHIRLSEATAVPDGEAPPGVAPALPAAVPADVRRALAGGRRVVVARTGAAGVDLLPGWWDQHFGLVRSPDREPVRGGAQVAVAVDIEAGPTTRDGVGLVLHGSLDGATLRPERATFWRGARIETVELPAAPTAIELPD